ncbi:N-acetyl-gamma-glutamyl-phosphate reductase [Temperatibacter marinus]|uniref:N-acetyl-gamma-glutamyl-phosphate reductase n=1 Tax=Temperatibacter marinus TaxID=1456591 RepID=A0AA52EGP6_9PROT|nr:N-acetyl-gamma-glutamyl-phosphate reductase [Temperatibacter marinus]WND02202.1 N-acetyl-gamma-glutamyl-phosphate reductase [Temperatibacter marinus]
MTNNKKIKVGILGASGYTGSDLVRLLINHPNVDIKLLTAERKAGQTMADIFPHFIGHDLPILNKIGEIDWATVEVDVIFCALPHATSQEIIKGIFEQTSGKKQIKVIDLSADFRLRDPDTYKRWYGNDHTAIALQPRAIYGLTEYYRESVKSADLVACPGCYPTAILLALKPLLKQDLIKSEDIIIDAKSGVTGAGRSLRESNLFTEVSEAMNPYGVGHHRHMPEIEQELSVSAESAVTMSFTPHLVPMNRGELITAYVKLEENKTIEDLRKGLAVTCDKEHFMTLLKEDQMPATRMVRGSNNFVVNVYKDRIKGRAIVIAAIDNLVKGSSGQAIQNMNVMMGLDEECGLKQVALFP